MFVVRDIVRCKPGKSRQVAELFKSAIGLMQGDGGSRNARVLLDMVADYWTVVLESDVEDLAEFERQMEAYANRQDIRKAMEGYVDLVEGGRREVFRVV